MKNYRNSHISCLINAMAVLLLLLLVSCSSNWRLAYLKNEEARKVDAKSTSVKSESSTENLLSFEDEEMETVEMDPQFVDSSYRVTGENEQVTVNRDMEAEMMLPPIIVRAPKMDYTPVRSDGKLEMSLLVELPKDVMASNWQVRVHPTMYLRQNKVETASFPIEDLYITGSKYRDRQIRGYERYSKYLSKIYTDGAAYINSKELNIALNENISDFVNKYQLEYFIKRNYPEIYSLKNDSSYVSDEEFAAALDVEKQKIISHYYNKSLENKVSKLKLDKNKNFNEMVYNPITKENVKGDNIVSSDTLDSFDEAYAEILSRIKDDDTLKKRYYKYLEDVKTTKNPDFPDLKSEKYKFQLLKDSIIYGSDTSKIYMKFDYSTMINAFQYIGLDKVFIGLTGDIYDDTTHVYSFTIPERLEYFVTSMADLADTTEIWYTDSLVFRKAESNEAYSIGFERRSSTLNERFGNNAEEIANVKTKLESLLKNTEYDLDSIIISATASPEGTLKINSDYSDRRSQSISRYFQSYVNSHKRKYELKADSLKREAQEYIASAQTAYDDGVIPKEDLDYAKEKYAKEIASYEMPDIEFKYQPIPENWDDLYTYVSMDSIMTQDEKNLFYDTYDKYSNVDVRENAMKKHSYYNYMLNNLYTKIRVVKFQFHMHKKGMLFDTLRIPIPDKLYAEGVKALRNFDFIRAEEILSNYPTYNAAICFIVRKKPLQAIRILEDPVLKIDFEKFKTSRDSLSQLYIATDTSDIQMRDSLMKQIESVKEPMDKAGKINLLKAKAYFMRKDYDKALESYLFLIRLDKLNGLYSKIITGQELKGGSVFGSSEYFEFTANTDEYLSSLPRFKSLNDKIAEYKNELGWQLWAESKNYFTPEEWEQYNNLKEAYLWKNSGDMRTDEELETLIRMIFAGEDTKHLEEQ